MSINAFALGAGLVKIITHSTSAVPVSVGRPELMIETKAEGVRFQLPVESVESETMLFF